jgi:hypothetical protein
MAPDTLSTVLQWLTNAGYTEDLAVAGNGLRATPSGHRFAPAELIIAAVYRFEGQTDPGDEAILFALETPEGAPVGTLAAPYGPMGSAEDEDVMRQLHVRSPAGEDIEAHPEHDHIAAVFTDRAHGEAAVLELLELGLGSEHLGVAIRADTSAVFEHDEEAELARDVEAGMATGVPTGFLAGMALAALAVPGIGVLGTAGLFAIGAASGFGGAMLGGFLGIAAADRAMTEHEELAHIPLAPGEVLIAVCSHGQPDAVRAVMQRHGGRLLTHGPVLH